MDRLTAKKKLYEIINSGIIDFDISTDIEEIANHICDDDWEKCDTSRIYQNYCEGCEHECENIS